MRAVTFVEIGKLELTDVPKPTIEEPTDALLKVTTTAICGSDLHVLSGRIPGMMPGNIIGHEFIGVVEEVGPEVRGFKPGDRALASFIIPCGRCWFCVRGQQGQCQDARVFGYGIFLGDVNGGQTEYVRIPNADLALHQIGPELTDEQALFAGDILSTGVHVAAEARIQEGDTVAVVGCGPVGLFAIQAARTYKPARIYAIDSVDQRLEMAEGFGAIPLNLKETNPVVALQDATEAGGADVVLECVGGSQALIPTFDMVRFGGRIAVIGVHSEPEATMPLQMMFVKGIDLKFCGTANVVGHWDEALRMIREHQIDPEAIISHRLPLDDALRGYELFESREAMKVVLKP
ncbi:MAG TPA: alcohol dehydrogenase catalytic domain-containing protein [Candidatus Dormibacteraeota bacterium]|jgi:threonine dehydrogenase-like Zn-dependent dehydrogenase|nr:alcohol dehydrogenase catalytic domain-containing protein [Candidatus Dormibacteraeota bacterium]